MAFFCIIFFTLAHYIGVFIADKMKLITLYQRTPSFALYKSKQIL